MSSSAINARKVDGENSVLTHTDEQMEKWIDATVGGGAYLEYLVRSHFAIIQNWQTRQDEGCVSAESRQEAANMLLRWLGLNKELRVHRTGVEGVELDSATAKGIADDTIEFAAEFSEDESQEKACSDNRKSEFLSDETPSIVERLLALYVLGDSTEVQGHEAALSNEFQQNVNIWKQAIVDRATVDMRQSIEIIAGMVEHGQGKTVGDGRLRTALAWRKQWDEFTSWKSPPCPSICPSGRSFLSRTASYGTTSQM
ncbi:hypothetical protein QFC20_003715 [Naganishia adeliensis]|uniref:Uncharacterized protein n=1 Tax=Naganishia adeliensis TaxID=92952 RepID=A0ACC2W7M5_9TREE|nr:hypothetical protein QFC20_003715 [Naganishia adeliensis]